MWGMLHLWESLRVGACLENILWQLSFWATVWPYPCFKEALKGSSSWTYRKAQGRLSGAGNRAPGPLIPVADPPQAELLKCRAALGLGHFQPVLNQMVFGGHTVRLRRAGSEGN